MVRVEPVSLGGNEQFLVDETQVDGAEGERFEFEELAVADLAFDDQNEILDTDAIGARLVVAGLVGDDLAGLERQRVARREADRAFVDAEERSDAVTGAVIVGNAILPEEL